MALENIIKYGILIDPLQWLSIFVDDDNLMQPLLLAVGANVFILASFLLEYSLLARRLISNTTGAYLAMGIVLTLLSLPVVIFRLHRCNPILASMCCSMYSILSLKLTSYHMVNYWCRLNIRRKRSHVRSNSLDSNHEAMSMMSDTTPSLVVYPNNLRLGDMYYFLCAPTLCYELNFPRSERIRFRFLVKRILELVGFVFGFVVVVVVLPLANSMSL